MRGPGVGARCRHLGISRAQAHSHPFRRDVLGRIEPGRRLAQRLGFADRAQHWNGIADKVGSVILERCWNEKRKAYTAAIDTRTWTQCPAVAGIGMLDSADPRFASTVAAIESELVKGRHVLRYAAQDDFGLPESEFLVCRFWLIDALCLWDGKKKRAIASRTRSRSATISDFSPRISIPKDRPAVGQFSPDLFHGRPDLERHASQQKLGGTLLARIFIISNRVATPQAGLHAGGLEVVLKATLKNHPCVWMAGRARSRNIPRPARSSRREQLHRQRPHPRGFRRILQWLR